MLTSKGYDAPDQLKNTKKYVLFEIGNTLIIG